MSLLNAWITPQEALIAVDTLGIRRDGSSVTMAKLFPIPQFPAVLGFRGASAFAAAIVQACLFSSFDSFDDLLAVVPLIADSTHAPAFPGCDGEEFIAAGWSPRRERIVARTFAKRAGAELFTVRESNGCIAPWDEQTMGDLPKTPDALERIAAAQVRYMRAAGSMGGGRLVTCRLRKDAIDVQLGMMFELEEAACLQ